MKQMKSLFTSLALILSAVIAYGQYTVDWVANTYSDNTHHVGNCARSMWVDTNGTIYTASLWDENAGGIGIYKNGQNLGSMGAHGELQGCSIAGDAYYIFAEEQGVNGGKVGRYNRTTHIRETMFSVSSTNGDSIPGLAISPVNGLLYCSDKPGNRIRVFTTNGVWQQDWTVATPGTLTVDSAGHVWVAQMTNATVLEFDASGNALNTITMNSSSRPSALFVDAQNQLWVGDQGPDENIKIYNNLNTTPTLSSTYGVTGGYLSTANGAIKGQTGAKRFTRVVGIGADASGNLYVLNNPWGGTWDLGRNGGTDLHCYNTSGSLAWTLQSLNFEGVAEEDSGTDGTNLYSGEFIFTGSSGAGYLANTVDPFDYPNDERLDVTNNHSRGIDFGMLAAVGTNRILIACGQNPDSFNSYYFNAANGYIAVPGVLWGANHERNGFCLDSAGNVWEGRDKTGAIWFDQLLGFDANNAPIYAAAVPTTTPASIGQLNRILYLPGSDTMILAGGASDWTSIGANVQVYNGWRAGNTNNPNTLITLNTNINPHSLAAAGGYLFVAYVHTIPNIDVYDLTTGAFVLTMTNSATVYVGNDVDSMYGLRAYQKANGQYVVTKDDYNGSSVVIYRWTPGGQSPPPAPTGLTATAVSSSQINLSWTASSGATSYNVKRASVNGGPYTTIATGVTATSYSDAGLGANTTYYYVVSAVNSAGEGNNSAQASATTLAGSVPPAPTGLTATAVSSSEIDLSWTASSGATSYNVKRATVSGGPYTTIATGVTTTTYNDTGLASGTTYYYVVSAVNGNGESANSTEASATTLSTPLPPTGLTATAVSPCEIDESWTASAGATSYNVKRATVSGGPYTTIASGITSTSYTDTGLAPATAYYYVVSAVNNAGESANSSEATATTVAGLPCPWLTEDIGAVGVAGSAGYTNGTFTITGSGTDINRNADQFRYAYQSCGTTNTITARVVNMTNPNSAAKAGVMFRETLDTNSTEVSITLTPANGVTWQYRTSTGGTTTGARAAGLVAPYWVQLVRNGSTFTGYASADGVTWTQEFTVSITMANTAYAGLAVTSRNNAATCTANFDNVNFQ